MTLAANTALAHPCSLIDERPGLDGVGGKAFSGVSQLRSQDRRDQVPAAETEYREQRDDDADGERTDRDISGFGRTPFTARRRAIRMPLREDRQYLLLERLMV